VTVQGIYAIRFSARLSSLIRFDPAAWAAERVCVLARGDSAAVASRIARGVDRFIGDTPLILVAVLGVSAVVLTVPWVKIVLGVIGVCFLLVIGWVTWRSEAHEDDATKLAHQWPVRRQIIFALSVSLLNPHAILDTIGVIGTSSLAYAGGERIAFTAACVLNSWVWFFLLVVAGKLIARTRIGPVRKWLNRVSAVIIWISAVYLVYNLTRIA
jgi:L-lysine exporter family protein LysE/ArgO